MREFEDDEGRRWMATVRDRSGPDFKGRYGLVFRAEDADPEREVSLGDVRWNGEKTARRTLRTMSEVELRRRLRSALGRAEAVVPGTSGS